VPAIHRGDSNEDVFDQPFAYSRKYRSSDCRKMSGIEQFDSAPRAPRRLFWFHEGFVGKFGLRILVEHPHIAVRGSRIEVEVIFFTSSPWFP